MFYNSDQRHFVIRNALVCIEEVGLLVSVRKTVCFFRVVNCLIVSVSSSVCSEYNQAQLFCPRLCDLLSC